MTVFIIEKLDSSALLRFNTDIDLGALFLGNTKAHGKGALAHAEDLGLDEIVVLMKAPRQCPKDAHGHTMKDQT